MGERLKSNWLLNWAYAESFGLIQEPPKKVEGEQGLAHKVIPLVQREVLVNAAKASDEVVFECADGAFDGLLSMHAGRGELEVNFFFLS
jgi:hypothetical protein